MRSVSSLSIAPVKGLALVQRDEIELGPNGVADDRRFYLIDEIGRRFGLMECGAVVQAVPEYDEERGRLAIRFPDERTVDGDIVLGKPVTTDFYGRAVQGRVVEGPWAAALSEHAGRSVRLVRVESQGQGVDRGNGPVTLVSDASVEGLARHSGVSDGVDARRFRMLIGVAGSTAHEEDAWVGQDVRIGEAVVQIGGYVGRCAITTQNPDTGARDFETLKAIKAYRGLREGQIDMGVYGHVVEPGRIRVGDPVEPFVHARVLS